MKRLNAIARLTMGLVSLTVALVLLADLSLGLLPSDSETLGKLRQRVSENLASQTAVLLQARDLAALHRTLQSVRARDEDIRSIGLRRLDGTLIADAGDHARQWDAPSVEGSTLTSVMVPIRADGARWGTLEIAYRSPWARTIGEWLDNGTVRLMLLLSVLGPLVYYLYLRRVLQHLDPEAAVPDRVRSAFDTLTEAVMIVNSQERVVLTNASFRNLGGGSADSSIGKRPQEIRWLARAVRDEGEEAPWKTAMRAGTPVAGRPVSIAQPGQPDRKAMINCAPIMDGGAVRGCMVTLNDVTQIERAHEQLMDALADLAASKQQLEVRNDELQRLASRDPLTGCLNRRSFFEGAESAWRLARQRGTALACIICDIDHFKQINDNFGHAVGDQVIRQLGASLMGGVRQADLVCRYGGEEFCVVLPGMDAIGAAALAERLRIGIESGCAQAIPGLGHRRVTTSFGVSAIEWGAESIATLIDQADQALYVAKRDGRNRVVDFASSLQTGERPQVEVVEG